jgi:lipopolysaccharide/colanic/teichoic acid biosynthesis glycosyltransferase
MFGRYLLHSKRRREYYTRSTLINLIMMLFIAEIILNVALKAMKFDNLLFCTETVGLRNKNFGMFEIRIMCLIVTTFRLVYC